MKSKIFKCIRLFAILFIINFVGDYFLRPLDMDISRNLSIAIGFSIGATFIDFSKILKNK